MQVYQSVMVAKDGVIGMAPGVDGVMTEVRIMEGAVGVVVGVADPVAVKFTNLDSIDRVIEIAASDLRVL